MDTLIASRTAVAPMQVPQPMAPRDFTNQQLALIKRTVASDCNDLEFNLYMEVARRAGADPFRRHLYAVVYSKDDPEKRKMSIITGIDFFRATAARNRDYRPDDEEPQFEVDETLKSAANPAGLVKATVKAFKLGPDGKWYPVVGTARWVEFAVMKEDGTGGFEWEKTDEIYPPGHKKAGKNKYRKKVIGEAVEAADGKWASMPHIMLAKCAEAQALRKGWPENLSGIYSEDEMLQAGMVDITASGQVELHEQEQRLHRVGAAGAVGILWEAGKPIEAVQLGQLADRCFEYFRNAESVTQLEWWKATNTAGLNEFWARAKSDALAVKRALEDRVRALQSDVGATDAA